MAPPNDFYAIDRLYSLPYIPRPHYSPIPSCLASYIATTVPGAPHRKEVQKHAKFVRVSRSELEYKPALPSSLLSLPLETRRKILGHCLNFVDTAVIHEQSKPHEHVEADYEWLAKEAWPKSKEYRLALSKSSYTVVKPDFHTNVLRVCKQLCQEGLMILRHDNRYVAIQGFDEYLPIKDIMSLYGDFPSWEMPRMQMEQIRVADVWDGNLPDLNIVARITNVTEKSSAQDFALVFPINCLKFICYAIPHLPSATLSTANLSDWSTIPGTLRLHLSFPRGLLPEFFAQNKEATYTSAFWKILSKDVARPLGKWVRELEIERRVPRTDGLKGLRCVEVCFANDVVRRNSELHLDIDYRRSLRELVTALRKGEILVHGGCDLLGARNHFFTVKESVCLIEGDFSWPEKMTHGVSDQLQYASDWACYRIATLPLPNEEDQLQAELSEARKPVHETQALLMLTHIAQGSTWPLCDLMSFLPTPSQARWYARLHLRRAELGFMAGLPYYRSARGLFQAAIILAPTDLSGGQDNNEPTIAVIQWAFDYLYSLPQGRWYFMPRANRFDLIWSMGQAQSADESYWKTSWQRMRGRLEDNEELDRKCFIDRWAKVKKEIEERFGKVDVCPIDFEGLLLGEDESE